MGISGNFIKRFLNTVNPQTSHYPQVASHWLVCEWVLPQAALYIRLDHKSTLNVQQT